MWGVDDLPLSDGETRLVLPGQFADWWTERYRATQASRLARALRIDTMPSRISTALTLAVRLELRNDELFRKWVTFSEADRVLLVRWGLPEGELNAAVRDAVRFDFDPGESPLLLEGPVQGWPCDEGSPDGLHHYSNRWTTSPRSILER